MFALKSPPPDFVCGASHCLAVVQKLKNPEQPDIQARLLLRNPLVELRVWILDLVFGNSGTPSWPILADSGASGPQTSILEVLTDLGTQNESSGACLRPNFGHFRQKCERFSKIVNFKIMKLPLQSLISYPEVS